MARTILIAIVLVALWLVLRPGHPWGGNRYRAPTMSDLRNLVFAQESYFADYGRYYAGPILPASSRDTNAFTRLYQPSTDVRIALTTVTDSGWAARASHAGLPDLICTVYVGNARPFVTLERRQPPEQVACNYDRKGRRRP